MSRQARIWGTEHLLPTNTIQVLLMRGSLEFLAKYIEGIHSVRKEQLDEHGAKQYLKFNMYMLIYTYIYNYMCVYI